VRNERTGRSNGLERILDPVFAQKMIVDDL